MDPYQAGLPLFSLCGCQSHRWYLYSTQKSIRIFVSVKVENFSFRVLISVQWTNILNPDNVKGLSATSMLLAMIGNGLMIPRALFIRDLMWYVYPFNKAFLCQSFTCLCKVSIDLISPVEIESADHKWLLAGLLVLVGHLSSTDGETSSACIGNLFASLRTDFFC